MVLPSEGSIVQPCMEAFIKPVVPQKDGNDCNYSAHAPGRTLAVQKEEAERRH
jgi:hypothetical protein